MDDLELIDRAKRGDALAIRALYQQYAPRVYAIVRRIAADDALAEDWAQEAWIRALRALPEFRRESRFSTWLHRIAVNSALHGRRTRERRTKRESAAGVPSAQRSHAPTTLLRLRLEAALCELPDGMREVLMLHDVEGYTHEEIGALLGIATGTSKSQLFKARARMRTLLEPADALQEEEEVCRI
ncbi:MAG: RNA polymerase sigma factor [Longimicrobiales bacterium]